MASGRKRFKNGDYLRIHLLPWVNIYAYGWVIDYRKMDFDVDSPIRFYVMKFCNKALDDDLIVDEPFSLVVRPIEMGEEIKLLEGWKIVGSKPVREEDCMAMSYKICPSSVDYIDRATALCEWFVNFESDPSNKKGPFYYDEVRHLRTYDCVLSVPRQLTFVLYLEWCKLQQYSISHLSDKYWWENAYKEFVDIPLYRDIPDQFKESPCPGGITKLLGKVPRYQYENPFETRNDAFLNWHFYKNELERRKYLKEKLQYFPFEVYRLKDEIGLKVSIKQNDSILIMYSMFFKDNNYLYNGFVWMGHIVQILEMLDPEILDLIELLPEDESLIILVGNEDSQIRILELLHPIFFNLDVLQKFVLAADREKIENYSQHNEKVEIKRKLSGIKKVIDDKNLHKPELHMKYMPFEIDNDASDHRIFIALEDDTVYRKYYTFFEQHGYEGNGYCWEGHITQILEKTRPDLLDHLEFVPETGSLTIIADSERSQSETVKHLYSIFSDLKVLEKFVKSADRERIDD